MPSGEAFTDGQQREITRAVTTASAETGLHFSIFVGNPEGSPRDYAERLHAALGRKAAQAVLVLVAPGGRHLEVVAGPEASRRIPDRACALAGLSMRAAFAGGDLCGGIVTGVRMLAETAGARAIAGGGAHGGSAHAALGSRH